MLGAAMDEQQQQPRAKPYAGWSSLGFGLVALAFALWVLLRGDVIENVLHTPKDEPFLLVALVNGILGTLAGIVALARREPLRLAILGLVVSLVAVLAKFFLVAVVIAAVLFVVAALLGGLG
jgi:hypothetical protein